MKCCKKTLVLAAVLAGGVAILATTGLGTHARHKAVAWFKKQIPLEDQVEAVKIDITRMDSEIDSGWPKIAKYETEIKDLTKDLNAKRDRMATMETELAAATNDLEAKVVKVKYSGKEYSPSQAGKILNRELNLFVALKREVASKSQLLSARQQKLDTAMAVQKEMINQKSKLQAEVAQIEADLETLRLQQTESKLPSNRDSRLDNIKEKVRSLRNQIEEGKRVNELRNQHNPDAESTPVPEAKEKTDLNDTVVRRVREVLGNNQVTVNDE
jgi:chromosome segregation ATPase